MPERVRIRRRVVEEAMPRPTMSVQKVNVLEPCWADIEEALRAVLEDPFARPPKHNIDYYSRAVYRIHAEGYSKQLNDVRVPQFLRSAVDEKRQIILRSIGSSDFLQVYRVQWERFRIGMEYANAVFCVGQNNEAKKTIQEQGYECWLELLYLQDGISDRVQRALLDLVEQDRRSVPVDSQLMQKVIQSICALRVYDTDGAAGGKAVPFERRFLDETQRFYKREVAEFLSRAEDQATVLPEYMKHVQQRLSEEGRRVDRYLDASSRGELDRCLIRVTIDQHIDALLQACLGWFADGREEEQKRLFQLLERSDGGLEPLRKIVEDRIDEEGKAAIQRAKADVARDPTAYVEAILEVHRRYWQMVVNIFTGHPYFKEALDVGCKRFINKNAIATSSGARSAELVAKYVHALLKTTTKASKAKTEGEIEQALEDVLKVYRLLSDTDVFQKVYRDKLSQRLIQGSYNNETEQLMINKLKEVCDYEYTYKLQRMFRDISNSSDLTKAFREEHPGRQGPAVDFSVLTSVSWPQTAQKLSIYVPPVIMRELDAFAAFYRKEFKGRSLQWLHTQCNGTLKTLYTATPYELVVSTYQAAVLLAFDNPEVTSLSFEQLREATQLSAKDLEGTLAVLGRARDVLKVTEAAESKFASVQLNTAFASTRKVMLHNLVHREGAQAEDQAAMRGVAEDRKFAIQAAIVRVMKTRKQAQHNELLGDVVSQLRGTFTPTQVDLKKGIESLIEKDYIERTADGKAYIYLT